MATSRSQSGTTQALLPLPPGELGERAGGDRGRLAEARRERVETVLELTAPRRATPGHEVEAVAEDSFERLARSSTFAVARWIGGESIEAAIEAGRETWE